MTDALKAIDELLANMPDDGPPEGDEFTVLDFVERAKAQGRPMGRETAQKRLKALVDQGLLTSRDGRVNGKQGKIYCPKK